MKKRWAGCGASAVVVVWMLGCSEDPDRPAPWSPHASAADAGSSSHNAAPDASVADIPGLFGDAEAGDPFGAAAADAGRTEDAGTPPPARDGGDTGAGCRSRGGSGSPTDSLFQAFSDSRGQAGQYHLFPSAAAAPAGLLVYLHGDGAYAFDHPDHVLDELVATARSHGLMTLAVRTPARDETWWTESPDNGPFLAELIEEVVLRAYDVDTARVLLFGYSGGGYHLTSWFIPVHAEVFCGGAALIFGGGSQPYQREARGDIAATVASSLRMHFYTGTADQYYDDAIGSADYYRRQGFDVSEEHPAGVDHYDIPFVEVLEEQLAGGILD